jgi:hypothetical protein
MENRRIKKALKAGWNIFLDICHPQVCFIKSTDLKLTVLPCLFKARGMNGARNE